MAVRTIIKWPNDALAQVCDPIKSIDDDAIKLASDLRDTMYTAFGMGLAASQVGVHKAMCVIEYSVCESQLPPDPLMPSVTVMINPAWEPVGDDIFSWEEACLSVDGIQERVNRYSKISLAYTNLAGDTKRLLLSDKVAGVVQHETDHLAGKVFIDRLPKKKASSIKRQFLRSMRAKRLAAVKDLRREKMEALREATTSNESPQGFRHGNKVTGRRKKKPKTFGKNKRRKK